MAEQRYKAVLAVIGDGRQVSEVAAAWGVSRQTLHAWLARYEAQGLEGLGDRSHWPGSCPHQMPGEVAARVLELRRSRPYWGPRRIRLELIRLGVSPVPSESAILWRQSCARVCFCSRRGAVAQPVRARDS